MNAKLLRSAALVAIGALQNAFNEAFFEFADGLIKQDAAIHHLSHKPFELISHVRTLRRKIS